MSSGWHNNGREHEISRWLSGTRLLCSGLAWDDWLTWDDGLAWDDGLTWERCLNWLTWEKAAWSLESGNVRVYNYRCWLTSVLVVSELNCLGVFEVGLKIELIGNRYGILTYGWTIMVVV